MTREMTKSVSEKLPMQLDRIHDILKAASIGVYRITMRDGMHPKMQASAKMRQLLGIDEDSNISDEEQYDIWLSRIPKEDMDSVNESVRRMFEGERDENVYRYKHPQLGMIYVRCGGVASVGPDGTRIVEGYHYDITAQVERSKQDELVVNSLANIYACLFYVELEKNHYISYINKMPTLENYLPKDGKFTDVLDMFCNKFCQPGDRQLVKEFCNLQTLNERFKYNNTLRIQFQDTLIGWVRLSFIVSDRNSDGTVKHLVVTLKDITETKEKELERLNELKVNISANRSKTMMLQNMTHEIRTPLNAMFGFSQLLCMPDGTVSDTQKREYFNYIYNGFNMLSMLIDDVLDVADAEHGNYRIQKAPFAVNEMCHNAMEMAEMRRQAGVNLYYTTEVADDYTIVSDSHRIEQVLVNILTNACKHTQKGEIHMHVSTTENPGKLTFSVTDTGDGIPPEQAKDIFERYKKANDTVQGSGIGLHICSLIADKLGAEVKLDETYTGGARFLFIL